jgi:hypothetical protein
VLVPALPMNAFLRARTTSTGVLHGSTAGSDPQEELNRQRMTQNTKDLGLHMTKWMNRFALQVFLQAMAQIFLRPLTKTPMGGFAYILGTAWTLAGMNACKVFSMLPPERKLPVRKVRPKDRKVGPKDRAAPKPQPTNVTEPPHAPAVVDAEQSNAIDNDNYTCVASSTPIPEH